MLTTRTEETQRRRDELEENCMLLTSLVTSKATKVTDDEERDFFKVLKHLTEKLISEAKDFEDRSAAHKVMAASREIDIDDLQKQLDQRATQHREKLAVLKTEIESLKRENARLGKELSLIRCRFGGRH